jgi:hypothetical protein
MSDIEVTFACRNPLCDRRVTMALYCCAPCARAHDDVYEIHEDGPLAHTAACDERTRQASGEAMSDTMSVFVIKAKDNLALQTVSAYRDACIKAGLTGQAEEVGKAHREIYEWRARHPEALQMPDHPHVAVAGPPDRARLEAEVESLRSEVERLTETIESHAAQCDAGQQELARLRDAAQGVVDAVAFHDSTLTTGYRNVQRDHIMAAARDLRAVLASADSGKERER